jgi:hypothetical protein
MVERQQDESGRQVIDISCFWRASHVVSTDIWEKRFWVNNYIDLETYNDVFDSNGWETESVIDEE